MPDRSFEIVCEIEAAAEPGLGRVRRQVAALSSIASAYLVPDNHLGHPTVSSIAVAHEIASLGSQAIASINCRDRNLLGFQRDLLTAATFGIERLLLVYGDRRPSASRAEDGLTVQKMIEEERALTSKGKFDGYTPFSLGVTVRTGPVPEWKHGADFWFVQASFDIETLLEWRSGIDYAGPIYAGVLVVTSPRMAHRLMATSAQINVPPSLVERFDVNPLAGVEAACAHLGEVAESGLFAGVHLICVHRFVEVAARLCSLGYGVRLAPGPTREGT